MKEKKEKKDRYTKLEKLQDQKIIEEANKVMKKELDFYVSKDKNMKNDYKKIWQE